MNTQIKEELEITDSNLKPANAGNVIEIPVIENDMEYSEFFQSFLILNKPCIINNVSQKWPCFSKWIKNKTLDTKYFLSKYTNVEVPISNCREREYNVQKKSKIPLHDYLNYWENYKTNLEPSDCLYLKDWHFFKDFPKEDIYRVPSYFASDWLNEYYDNHLDLNDDYRFVYIGPKGSWTPFHADVFDSYSWSVNISGRKKWILLPPGTENHFRDKLGNLNYDIDLSTINNLVEDKKVVVFEIIQEEGQGLFVPSGWHHQVWNLEDAISINHNWINGCNIYYVWESLKKNLSDVMKEISDCKDMENWMVQCQLILATSFGFDYLFFQSFLREIAEIRIRALKTNERLTVYGNWSFEKNHLKFDLKQILNVLNMLQKDDNYLEISNDRNSLNHSLEFLDSLSSFLKSDDYLLTSA